MKEITTVGIDLAKSMFTVRRVARRLIVVVVPHAFAHSDYSASASAINFSMTVVFAQPRFGVLGRRRFGRVPR